MNEKGSALVMILLIFLSLMILIPAMVFLVQHEGKATINEKKNTLAFQAAEAGLDRAIWKLNEHSDNWDTVKNGGGGGNIEGYTGNTVYPFYLDAANTRFVGEYKLTIIPGPVLGEVLIRSVGRDSSRTEVRAIEVVLTKNKIFAAMDVEGALNYKPNFIVHWGPVVCYQSITNNSNMDYFPRKFAAGMIRGNPVRDTNPTPPNSDGLEYWAFEDLGDTPQVDLAAYKTIAKNSGIPANLGGGNVIRKGIGADLAVADPAGSGFFPKALNNGKIRFFGDYSFTNSTSVIYTDGEMDFANGVYLDLRAVVAEDIVDFNARGGNYPSTVPAVAGVEYQWFPQPYAYPGYTAAVGDVETFNVANCGLHGFLFCGGNLNNAGGGSIMVGAAKVLGEITMNTFTIYYDPVVAGSIIYKDALIRQKSWKEIKLSW